MLCSWQQTHLACASQVVKSHSQTFNYVIHWGNQLIASKLSNLFIAGVWTNLTTFEAWPEWPSIIAKDNTNCIKVYWSQFYCQNMCVLSHIYFIDLRTSLELIINFIRLQLHSSNEIPNFFDCNLCLMFTKYVSESCKCVSDDWPEYWWQNMSRL